MTCKKLLLSLPTLCIGLSLTLGCDSDDLDEARPTSLAELNRITGLAAPTEPRGPFDEVTEECEFDGELYELGATWPLDECNTCTCTEDGVQCTLMHCPELEEACEYDGELYELGATWPLDECNTCTCTEDGVQCTLVYCPELEEVCWWEGDLYAVGETWKPDSCNICFCTSLGPKCTRMWCPNEHVRSAG